MDPQPTPDEPPVRRALDDICAVVAFMTRLPLHAPEFDLARACWAFPVAGLMVGAVGGVIFVAALHFSVPASGAALLALLGGAILTGALHEDGLADTADGLGGADPERRLEIMRDSHIGAYGVLALIFSVGLRAAALSVLASPSAGFAALAASAMLSRGLLPAMMHVLPLASVTGLAAWAGKPNRLAVLVSVGLAGAGAMICLGPALGIGGFVFSALAVATLALVARRLIGGYNGDTLGAAQQSAETAVLIFIAAAV